MMTQFPKDFLWSASTAATQIEGGWNADGRGESIWDTLVHDGTGRIAHSENADTAIDFYHRWREDVALMKEIGLTAYRFSISWPRILPEGAGRVNEVGGTFLPAALRCTAGRRYSAAGHAVSLGFADRTLPQRRVEKPGDRRMVCGVC